MSKTWTDNTGTIHQVIAPGRINSLSARGITIRAYLLERDGFVCQHCARRHGSVVFEDRLEIDHIIPWRDGGTNHPDNLQMLCPTCNKQKMRREHIWRANDKIGTPNDYRKWVQRWVPEGYANCTFLPNAWPIDGQGG